MSLLKIAVEKLPPSQRSSLEMFQTMVSVVVVDDSVLSHVHAELTDAIRSCLSLSVLQPLKGGRRFLMSPPCLKSQGFQFDYTFLYLLFYSSA